MQGHFNASALHAMSKTELLALKANLKAQFDASSSASELASIRSSIDKVDMALAQK